MARQQESWKVLGIVQVQILCLAANTQHMLFCALVLAAAVSSRAVDLEKGIIYVQPSYHYTNTLDLNLDVLKQDLDTIKAKGFSNVGLRVSWGELMAKWDSSTRTPTWNSAKCEALGAIASEVSKRGLKLIFNTHLKDTVPEGVDGAVYQNDTAPDSRGVHGGGFWHAPNVQDAMVRDDYREPMTLFHTQFARCLRDSPDAPRFWKHAFESTYFFPQKLSSASVERVGPVAVAKFRQWAKDNNETIEHWAQRWGEPGLSSFDQVTVPHDTGQQSPNKAKLGDYWRFWLLGVLKQGKYGLSIREIFEGIKRGASGAYAPRLAFKHWKPGNFISQTDLTMDEIKSAYDLPINATALGYYVNTHEDLANEPAAFKQYIEQVKSVAPSDLPIIDWETGASTLNLTESQSAEWARLMIATAKEEGLAGFNWWQFIDWAPVPSAPCATLTACQLLHFGAFRLNGTAKEVWSVL